ncbi:unnamed protein product, partial [Prorocentrum cordatum]
TALPPKPTNLPLAPLRGPRAGRASHGAVLPVIECSGKVCEHLSRQRLSEEITTEPEETEADKAKRELAERVLLSAQDASMQAARRAAEREGPLDPEYIYDEAFKAAEAAIEAAHVEGCDDRRDPGAGREGGLAVGDLGGNEDGQPAGQPGRGELRDCRAEPGRRERRERRGRDERHPGGPRRGGGDRDLNLHWPRRLRLRHRLHRGQARGRL